MAKYYYNGVLLPEIPADVLEEYPYAVIGVNESTMQYQLLLSKSVWYSDGAMATNDSSDNEPFLYAYAGDTAWKTGTPGNYGFSHSIRPLVWSSHDILNGSTTSTTIYLYGSEPVPEIEAKPKELDYAVFTNFYPSGSTITYAVSDLTINYVVPVKKYSTYTVTMTEVGNRLRVCYSTIDPATITASTSVTSITEPSSFPVGHTFTYFANADGWMVVYVSNAGERPEISIVTNGAGGDGAPLYDRKYLLRSGSTLYTVTDGTLTALDTTDLTAETFRAYGMDDLPDGSLLAALTDPEVLYWQDSADDLPDLTLTVTGTPPTPQVVVTDERDMSDPSILGIESATVTASEDVLFALSFDDGATWKAYDGSQWITLETEHSGMTKTTMESIGLEAWAEVITSTAYRVRFALLSADSYVTSVVINYINEEG